jgi:serine/threonine-protein phosphatase 2A activator
MIKMYLAEVLNKLPVVQHFLFGSILPYDGPAAPTSSENANHDAHVHTQTATGWGDCCGIAVPSVFAAAKAEKDRVGGKPLVGPGIRPVPFD